MGTAELFPDIARDAERHRKHQRGLDNTLHALWLDEIDPDGEKQAYLLRYLREMGPCALDTHFIQELESLGLKGKDKRQAWSLFLCTAICLTKKGRLWRYDLYDDVAVFGVRGIQKKADYLKKLR